MTRHSRAELGSSVIWSSIRLAGLTILFSGGFSRDIYRFKKATNNLKLNQKIRVKIQSMIVLNIISFTSRWWVVVQHDWMNGWLPFF